MNDDPELRLPVPGYEGFYEVSDLGRVRSVDRTLQFKDGTRRTYKGRLLRQSIQCATGYPRVGLYRRDVGSETVQVHRVVLAAFTGPLPEGLQTRHLNGDKTDNRLSNLRYGTALENSDDKRNHGTFGWTPARRAAHEPKTHCDQGHERSPDNLDGQQKCKICRRARARGDRTRRAS